MPAIDSGATRSVGKSRSSIGSLVVLGLLLAHLGIDQIGPADREYPFPLSTDGFYADGGIASQHPCGDVNCLTGCLKRMQVIRQEACLRLKEPSHPVAVTRRRGQNV
jgi:hypothetical protein